MNFFLQSALAYLLVYKYVALFIITYLAAIALPLPSAPSLMAASAFASQGVMNLWLVILTAIFGNVAGDITGYYLARHYGKPILKKIGFADVLRSPTYTYIEGKIVEHKRMAIFLSRVQVQATMAVNIIAGLSRIRFRTFIVYVVLGEAIQVGIYVTIGYIFGSNWEYINNLLGKFTLIILLSVILFFMIFGHRAVKRIHKKITKP